MKIIQIACEAEALYALDDEGNIYRRVYGAPNVNWVKMPCPIKEVDKKTNK